MTQRELRLASKLLEIASEKFSNHGCNDFEMPDDWSDLQCRDLDRAIHRWNGNPGEHEPGADHRVQMDWLLMRFFSARLRQLAEAESTP